LANYLQLIFAECNGSGSNTVSNGTVGAGSTGQGNVSLDNALNVGNNALQNGEHLLGYGTNADGSTYPQYGN